MANKPVALITGGTRGIGFGVAESLAAEGYDLALCGRREEGDVLEAIDKLKSLGVDVLYVQADIGETEARSLIIDSIRNHFGRLNVLVNNAGMAPRERLEVLEAKEETYDQVMNVNLKGPYFLTQLAARWMVEQKTNDADFSGSIVFVTSISSDTASVARGEYCISKAGLSMASQLWAVRLAEYDISVYEIRPGITKTDMTSGVKEKYDKLIDEGLLLQSRWGLPGDIGKAVAMLARGDLSYSTGQIINIDGGFGVKRL